MAELIPNPSEIIKEVKNALPQTVEAIDHALSTIANIGNTALTPIEYLNAHAKHCMDKVKLKLQKELAGVEPEKIISPPPYIAVPTLTAASYCVDCDELHDLFAKLLAKSMNSDTTYQAHPSFIEVIKQLSPFEARLIKLTNILYDNKASCIVRCQQKSKSVFFPYNTISPLFKSNTPGYDLFRCITFFNEIDCQDYFMINNAVENLNRLGLIHYDTNNVISDISLYNVFANKQIEEKLKNYVKELTGADLKENYEITLYPSMIQAMNYGIQFYNICVK